MNNFGFKMNVRLVLTNFLRPNSINNFRANSKFLYCFYIGNKCSIQILSFNRNVYIVCKYVLVNQHLYGKNIICEIIILIN
jgi:hypothetical protein